MKRDCTMPGAIVLGSIIVALGLYFGLREGREGREGREPAQAAAPRASLPASPPAAPGGFGFGMPAAPSEVRKKVEEQAAKALEAQRSMFVKTCWEPAVKQNATPATSKYVFNMSFDGATGRELSRGVSEIREASRADVGECLRALPIGLTIDPPGMNVNVDVTIAFPGRAGGQ